MKTNELLRKINFMIKIHLCSFSLDSDQAHAKHHVF